MRLRRTAVELCGERFDLAIFDREDRAREHIRRHVLARSERWETLLPPDLIDGARAGPPAALDALYDAFAARIEEGIRFGARLPIHVHVTRRREGAEGGARECLGFVSREGVRIYADRARVRTAYRAALRPEGHSDYAYFARAWFDLATRAPGPRTVESREGAVEEDVRRTCLPEGERAPPGIVAWRAMAGAAGEERRA